MYFPKIQTVLLYIKEFTFNKAIKNSGLLFLSFCFPGSPFYLYIITYISFELPSCDEQNDTKHKEIGQTVTKIWPFVHCSANEEQNTLLFFTEVGFFKWTGGWHHFK